MIVAAGLTPAWQQILEFDAFVPGEVNRARAATWCASGKVVNVGLSLHHLGGPSRTLSVIGGAAGEAIRADLAVLSVPARWIDSTVPTRICTTILDGASVRMTELVENAAPLPAGDVAALLAAYEEEAARATHVVLTGSLPPGTPAGFYRQLMERTPAGVPTFLDCRGPELIEALPMRPFLVKPNREELSRTVGQALASDDAVWNAMRWLVDRGATWVVVSHGGGPVFVQSRDLRQALLPPPVRAVNPIGCGDCLAAGIAWGLRSGLDPLAAIRFGMGCAADNLSALLPARLDATRAESFADAVGTLPDADA